MDLSETILAAMIGALATVSTALFQLFSAFKSNEKGDPRAKRGSKLKSLLSIAALMVASGVGGFLYSEFLKQRSVEQMEAMRAELREVRELAALAAGRSAAPASVPAPVSPAEPAAVASKVSSVSAEVPSSSEALIYVPACQPPATASTPATSTLAASIPECLEGEAQRVALCGTIPAAARVKSLELFAQPDALQQPWGQHVATLEQDLGGARFTGSSFEYAQSTQAKAVCVNFLHWSSAHPHLARMVVHYDFTAPRALPEAPVAEAAVAKDQAGVNDPAVNDPPGLAPQAASFIAPAAGDSE